ncbi:hypothetical protein GMRT_10109 [Giardia muris]|uniref:PPi-type phosphoenolpyruvate carboxykinase lobe 2 domain-containing protein n=1 Tax=Giardia muris TaxID=5742 RepID=A0A4Z1T5F9_GIAMU|nr:hypothetical protein GMRT_10109 [Giardia muris]|eukprot:TNJ27759.1 hypothetical protein GMRT_10109 [Giardia muris]
MALAEDILTRRPEADMVRSLGLVTERTRDAFASREVLREYINMKLQTLGFEPVDSNCSICIGSSTVGSTIGTPNPAQIRRAPGAAPTSTPAGEQVTVSSIAHDLLTSLRGATVCLTKHLSPVDARVQRFIDANLRLSALPASIRDGLQLPAQVNCFTMDRCGVAFELSTPFNANYYKASGTEAVHIPQGLLANPESDKRTTVGTFHVSEGHLPIPFDKRAVPTLTFAYLLYHALHPPTATLALPYTGTLPEAKRCHCWCSAYLTPVVQPGVNKDFPQKHMEVRFFAPGAYVSNLAFAELIFGNAGDPNLPENDLWLQPERNIGVTTCIIIAPHLRKLRKKDVGLPHIDQATERQRRDGMCWASEDELYNGGSAFKVCYRSLDGVSITLVADTYYGYTKKEIKTQISFAANIRGNAEEEHSGGCISFMARSWGRAFRADDRSVGLVLREDDFIPAGILSSTSRASLGFPGACRTFSEMRRLLAPSQHPVARYDKARGVLIDALYPRSIVYVPETMHIELAHRAISWTHPESGEEIKETMMAHVDYVLPNGYRVRLLRHPVSHTWMLRGTSADNVCNFHKPFTVSGGGKSEISKSVLDAITSGSFYVADFDRLVEDVEAVFHYDYTTRFRDGTVKSETRHILSSDRTLGSVIKLLTVDAELYTDEYNRWLHDLYKQKPDVLGFIFVLKALYRPSWGDFDSWKTQFRVDKTNGTTGHTIIFQDAPLQVNYLRVGSERDETGQWRWRNYRLRADYYPNQKIQTEDDISASTVVRVPELAEYEESLRPVVPSVHSAEYDNGNRPRGEGSISKKSYKFVSNCEYRFFQRPDDCVHPGIDKQCEFDMSRCEGRTFITNFEKISRRECEQIAADVMSLEKFSEPMQEFIKSFAAGEYPDEDYCVISALPRITGMNDGHPVRTANVRYLQDRQEWREPFRMEKYACEIALRLARGIPLEKPVYMPVSLVVPGRRLNPKDGDIRPLAVFNPMHYQELPELFMDLIPCLTGKSPSTTGAGVEGALTKGPFNSLLPIVDLNNCFLSLVLTGTPCFSTAAGYIGHKLKVDHDLSLIIPEVLSRMSPEERDPAYLIEHKYLEKVEDFEHQGKLIPASILGYRITWAFVKTFFSRVFDAVYTIFEKEHMKPELQGLDAFADGILNIRESQLRVIDQYFADGSVDEAVPPLKHLLHICKYGEYNGLNLHSPEFRKMFTRDYVIESEWYRERLVAKQAQDVKMIEANIRYIHEFAKNEATAAEARRRGLCADRIMIDAVARRDYLVSDEYLDALEGTLGVQVWANLDPKK